MSSVGRQFISNDYGQNYITSGQRSDPIRSNIEVQSVSLSNENNSLVIQWKLFPGIAESHPLASCWLPRKDGDQQSFLSFSNLTEGNRITSVSSNLAVNFMPDDITFTGQNDWLSTSGNAPEAEVYYPSQELNIQCDSGILIPVNIFQINLFFSQEIVSVPENLLAWEFQEVGEKWVTHEGGYFEFGITLEDGVMTLNAGLNVAFEPYAIRYTRTAGDDIIDAKGQVMDSFTYVIQNLEIS